MKYLFDTMTVSEPGKARANPVVVRWIKDVDPLDAAMSVLSLGEIEAGIVKLRDPTRRKHFERWLEHGVIKYFRNRILPFDASAARTWARLYRDAPDTIPVVDTLIAATAASRDLTVVTRDERHFRKLGVRVINPWP
jgi:toxin FitB